MHRYYYGPYRRHVRRVYRRAYRRAYEGYYGGYSYYQPYSYGDIILTPMEGIVRTISDLIVGMCVEFTVVHIDGPVSRVDLASLVAW